MLNFLGIEMKMAKRFEGKVVIVSASTQGIGFGIAERLGLEGASVVISSRKQVSFVVRVTFFVESMVFPFLFGHILTCFS